MNKNTYIEKIEEKLKHDGLYQEVKDPAERLKKEISSLTNKLFKERKVEETQKFDFKSIDSLAIIRGQPNEDNNLHKINNFIKHLVLYIRSDQTTERNHR